MKWQYLEAYSSVKVEGKPSKNGHRILTLNGQEYKLAEGLNFLGQRGWELVAVHSIDEAHGGEFSRIRTLTYLYIFKRSLAE
ncbi:MAG: hypothetical protein KME45_13405 [Stenomitos rutilans HA7619-LM2]|jgi:hypothetical protein|nr:hypothetical protein [Stenomitos rutilans HA7619-LM2]